MCSSEEWLLSAPEHDLLETDIGRGSFNKAPWIPETEAAEEAVAQPVGCVERSRCERETRGAKKLVLSTASGGCSLDTLKIDVAEDIGRMSRRSRCSLCHGSRKYYCYSCHVPLPETKALIPSIPELPIQIDIIKHPQEIDGKSTSIHAKVICPNSVRIFTYPDLPDLPEDSGTLLLFPDKNAKTLTELAGPGHDKSAFQRVLVIDSTWSQSRKILSDPRIAHLPKVVIGDRKTLYWRNQTGLDRDYLATIEAIYYLVSDYHRQVLGLPYGGEYDNLLFFFKFMYDRLHSQNSKLNQ